MNSLYTLFAKQSSSTAYKACKALHFEFKAIVWKDNEKHTAKAFISRVKIYKYICGPVSVGFANMSFLTRSSSSAFKLWKMWWRPAALRVVAWRHEILSPIWLWFSSTLDSDQLCTTPSRHTVMNLRSIVAAWSRISHLFAENEGNPGNCDGISTRYCCEMEEMLNLVFFFCSSSLKLMSQILWWIFQRTSTARTKISLWFCRVLLIVLLDYRLEFEKNE